MKKIICILAYLHISILLIAQNNAAVTAFVNKEALRHANISFLLRDLSNNKVVAEYNAQRSCTPASVTKVITTATALEILGEKSHFSTFLMSGGDIDENGILQDNLYINGTGDPTLGSRYFSNADFITDWINEIRAWGIKKIAGRVIADTSIYDNSPVPVLWLREDAGNYYGAGVFPLSVFDNMVSVKIKSTARNIEIIETAPNAGYTFNNRLKIGAKDSIYFSGEPYSNERTIYGTIRANTVRSEKCDISNPPQFLAKYLTEKLIENGIAVENKFFGEKKYAPNVEIVPVVSHTSPPLKDIAAMTNTFSNNNYAEHLLKHLALQKDSVASFNTALQVLREFWASKGIDVSGLFIYDGSGLSPKNAVSAAFICDVLKYMQANKAFYNSLPVAGESGTVASFLADTPLKGKAHVKSGSFRNVQCYAGYISKGGKDYAFSILVNNFTGERKNVVKLIEELLVGAF
ncbi:MAG: D-alanyl-D-alanine carboxypeptidase/D-alanyl-D-alanine-endopeptidase [Prevotellaceae bacterium]|jgi:D-alanyl-D-alanine carboxypeptidase/D-alanyl-D-alanine-endopeptidase (penicillin-binding protein 4)|nr:D-alanyl-D-alanine carboxypeptidase/D-alanyl-D-alanine-endopeptidase [Prevotellaceae bacterium]